MLIVLTASYWIIFVALIKMSVHFIYTILYFDYFIQFLPKWMYG